MAGFAPTTRLAALLAAAAAGLPAQVPEYVTGDECLFCHRNNIGVTWSANRHNRTTRPGVQPEEFLLGAGATPRTLRRTSYGHFALVENGKPNAELFNAQCAGCHMTMVDPKTRAASAAGIDCVACHGAVDLNHSSGAVPVWLGKNQRADVNAVNAACAPCHLRGAKFPAAGPPYPAAFLPGSIRIADLTVSPETVDPKDAHILRTVREAKISCLECHRVHSPSGRRHRLATPGDHCNDCHYPEGPRAKLKPAANSSPTCRY